MNFRQIEVLAAVIRCQSFSKAAAELFLTQPTVSSHVSMLEEELGIKLVTRGRKSVLPTRAGTVFLEYANGLLGMWGSMTEAMKHYPELLSSEIAVAASTVPAEYVLPRAVTEFLRKYPSVRFSIRESDSEQVVARLLVNEAELGFTGTMLENPKCVFDEVADDRLVIITPPCAPYADVPRDAFPAELLADSPFVLRAAGSATQKEADAFLISMGIAPKSLRVAAHMDSISAIKNSVKCGMGIAILSEITVRDMEERGEVLVFRSDSPFLRRKLYCAHRTDRPLSPSAELFLRFVIARAAAE